ncbi:helix-turn-helix transcriptional regulator [Hymenobacter sp. ASUV-10]|uniref:Helix-turn-helix transcriptional regulator n=1 Tax=Hymenobacter aranciens TaxID=3063996 RepID=A0ABT9BE35_9BACT|nr:helix-turn-helix transcriptional regulator [Hymenobacter sp. ASUV-10]MDO7874946.1 helix-turn-helix transcriptional regulator [Hymenobacter sp. ASUV-10]
MQVQQFAVPEALRAHVRYFWTMESAAGAASFRTIVDGCPGLLFQHGAAGLQPQAGKPWTRLLLHGQATQPLEVVSVAPFQLIGMCLQPGALASVFGLAAEELTDSCMDPDLLSAAPGFRLAERLGNADSVSAQLDQLTAYLQTAINRQGAAPEPPIEQAVQRIVATGGGLNLRQLQDELQLSERSFQRKFKQRVGVSPKLFARICQFQESLGQLRRAEYEKLSDIAYNHDYADQSHYIRAFREFAGSTPQQFRQQARGQVDDFPALRR